MLSANSELSVEEYQEWRYRQVLLKDFKQSLHQKCAPRCIEWSDSTWNENEGMPSMVQYKVDPHLLTQSWMKRSGEIVDPDTEKDCCLMDVKEAIEHI